MDHIRTTAKKMLSHTHVKKSLETVRPYAAPVHTFAKARPFVALALVAAVGYGVYWYFFNSTEVVPTTYTVGQVTKGTLVLSVTGTGQVSASNQVDLKAKISGDVTSVPVRAGQTVRAGATLLYIDSRDAQKTVRDARTSLATAQLSLDKIKKPTEVLTITQAENKIAASNDTLAKAYDDGYNNISNAFLELPGVMTGLQEVLYGTNVSATKSQSNIDAYGSLLAYDDVGVVTFKADAATKYKKARDAYDAAFTHYRTLTRSIDDETTEKEVRDTYELTKTLADAVKSSYDYLGYIQDKLKVLNASVPPLLTTHLTNLNTHTATTNTHLSSLLSITNTITTTKRNLAEYTQSLEDLKLGSDALDIESARLSVVQRQNALTDALEKLSDYTVRAPFTGTVASLDIQRGQSVSTGSAFGVLVTKDRIAEISLNEVDIAKIKVGQKATLTFDAVEDLSISGAVVAVDTLGAVTQGVVTYAVQIGFDTQDERVRPGMSVSASVITDIRTDVLLLPASAVKSNADTSYVEVASESLTEEQKTQRSGLTLALPLGQKTVTVGATDDTSTEITSGLAEGDWVITRSVKAAATTTAAPSLFGNMRPPGTGGTGGAGARTGAPGR